jgi:hypothetical protein
MRAGIDCSPPKDLRRSHGYPPTEKRVYYLLQRTAASAIPELAVMDLETGKSDPVLPGFAIAQYRISRDDRDALIATTGKRDTRQIWLVSLDRRQPPRLLVEGGDRPVFGPVRKCCSDRSRVSPTFSIGSIATARDVPGFSPGPSSICTPVRRMASGSSSGLRK